MLAVWNISTVIFYLNDLIEYANYCFHYKQFLQYWRDLCAFAKLLPSFHQFKVLHERLGAKPVLFQSFPKFGSWISVIVNIIITLFSTPEVIPYSQSRRLLSFFIGVPINIYYRTTRSHNWSSFCRKPRYFSTTSLKSFSANHVHLVSSEFIAIQAVLYLIEDVEINFIST